MISWLSALLGPIFAKEMVEMSRRVRYYLIRVIFGLALLFAAYQVLQMYRLYYERLSFDGGVSSLRIMPMVVLSFVTRIAYLQFIAVYLLVPFLLCGVVTTERDARTLDQLFTTHLTNREIVFGKLASRLIVMIMLILSGVPILSMFLLFGGVSGLTLIRIELAVLLAIAHVGAFAIYFATVSRTAFQALWKTYACVLSLLLIPPLSPSGAFMAAMDNPTAVGATDAFIAFVYASNLLIAGFMVNKAIGRIRDDLPPKKLWRSRFRNRHKTSPAPELRKHADAVAEKMRAVWGPLQIAVVDNEPPIAKNLWVFLPLLFAFGFNYVASISYETEALSHILLPIWIGSFVLTVIVAITNPLLSRRPGFFDLLLGTLLEPDEILRGTVLVSGPWLIRIFMVPWVFGILWSSWNPVGISVVLVTGTLFTFLILTLGNLCSLAEQGQAIRLICTISLPTLIICLPWILPEQIRDVGPVVMLTVAVALLVVSWLGLRFRVSALSTGILLVSVYFFINVLLVILPGGMLNWWGEQRLVLLVSPWYWMLRALDVRQSVTWTFLLQYVTHWLSLATTLVWAWYWTTRNFDRLVGRTLQDAPPSPQSTGSPVRLANAATG